MSNVETFGQPGSPLAEPGRLVPGSNQNALVTGVLPGAPSGGVLAITGSVARSYTAMPAVTVFQHGPDLTVGYIYTSGTGNPVLSLRVQFSRSDNAVLPNGTTFFFDSGWVTVDTANGSQGLYTINAIVAGIPTDTGTASVDPTLHLVATVLCSEEANHSTYTPSSSAAFDVQWGVSTLAWAQQPASLVSTPQITPTWVFSSTRGFPEGSWGVQLASLDGTSIFYDSSPIVGTQTSYGVPYNLVQETTYRITVSAWNANGVPAPPITALFLAGVALSVDTPIGGPLQRFLEMLAFQLNIDRSLAEQLRFVADPLRCPGNLLPALAQQLGVAYEAEMGMAQTRKLLSTVVHQYKIKGTAPGIEGISTAVTGWPAYAAVGPNLMLGANHLATVFPYSYPTLSTSLVEGTAGAPSVPSGYAGAHWPTAWPFTTTQPLPAWAVWANTAVSDSELELDSLQGSTPNMWGVPLSATLYSEISSGVYVWNGGIPGLQGTLYLDFWGLDGSQISGYDYGIGADFPESAWTQVVLDGGAVPAGTVWVSFRLYSNGAVSFPAGGLVVLAAPQIEADATLAPYSPPREIQISLGADRTNLFANPSFENGVTTGWSAVTNCSLLPVNGIAFQVPAVPNPGTWCLQVSSTAAGPMMIESALMPVEQALLYTASIYSQAEYTAEEVQVTLSGSNVGGAPVFQQFSGSTFLEEVGQWVRPYVQIDPGSQWTPGINQVSVQVAWLNTMAAGEIHYVDCALLEGVWALRPYFDADQWSNAPSGPDYFWTTASTKTGPSYYYKNYAAKLARLNSVLQGLTNDTTLAQQTPLTVTGFVPLGSQFSLLTGPQAISAP